MGVGYMYGLERQGGLSERVGVTSWVRADADEDRSERELRNKSGANCGLAGWTVSG